MGGRNTGFICVVYGGHNNQGQKSCSFHTFPDPDKERVSYRKWVKAVQKYRVWSPPKKTESRWKRTVMCSKHFEPSCFRQGLKRPRLAPGSVPTLYMEPTRLTQPGNFRPTVNSIIRDYKVSTFLFVLLLLLLIYWWQDCE